METETEPPATPLSLRLLSPPVSINGLFNADKACGFAERPVTPPSPTPRSMQDMDVSKLDLKDSVFSNPPPQKPNSAATAAERHPWPSHSATRAHLPAHADFHVQRSAPQCPPPKNRHVPARLSIMPRSSSGLVISTPTSMNSLSAMLEGGPITAEGAPGGPSLAFEIEQAEGAQEEDNTDAQSSEKPLTKETLAKDIPPPYSRATVASRSAAGRLATSKALAPSLTKANGPITPIPLSVLSAHRPSTPMGRLMRGNSNLNLSALIGSDPASPFSPGFNESGTAHNGFARDPMGPLAFLANSQRGRALEFVSMALSEDLASLAETTSEIDTLRLQLAEKEAQREAQGAKIVEYQTALDRALIALQEEKMELMAMRERVFLSGMQHSDEVARAGQSPHIALAKARNGWCRLWIDF